MLSTAALRSRWDALRAACARDGDRSAFAIAYLLLLPFYLAPLLATPLLPGLDLGLHLSLADMLTKSARPDSPYRPFYEGAPSVAPYAAHYLALWLMAPLVKLTTAHKLIVAAYVAGTPLAASSLLGACGRSRIPALLAFPLAFNLALHYGFISFALSLPVAVWLLALTARFLLAPAFEPRRLAATALVAVLLFLCHLQNFLWGLCAALGFVLFAGVRWRRRLWALLAFVPSVGTLAFWQVTAEYSGDPQQQRKTLAFAWNAVKWARIADMDNGTRPLHVDVARRLEEIQWHALRGFQDGIDILGARTLMALLLFYFVMGLVGLREEAAGAPRPRLRIASWIACGGALLAYMAMPHHLNAFEIVTFYPRFAPLVLLMALPLIPAGLRRFSGGVRALLPVPAALFVALYGWQLTKRYEQYGEEVADFVAVVDRLQPGRKLLGLMYQRHSKVMKVESAMLGLTGFYPALKPAPGSMTPLQYCGMRHIPCRKARPFDAVPDEYPWVPQNLRPDQAVPFFDYFLARSPPPAEQIFGAQLAQVEEVARKGVWVAWARKRGPAR